MTPLEFQQRGLLDLIKGRATTPQDPYLRRIEGSRELAMIREIAIWWRTFQLRVQCHFTSRLLERLHCFDTLVAAYFDKNPTSTFVEELSQGFLEVLKGHHDGLVRAVAQFESAWLLIRTGDTGKFEVLWDRHPDRVFLALENGTELPPAESECAYCIRMAQDLPQMFHCIRESRISTRL